MPPKKLTDYQVSSVIRKNLNSLRKPGVLTVRPGYEVRNHQLTGKQAIVATVHTKKKVLRRGEALPIQSQDFQWMFARRRRTSA
jgi:hypothetical protein